MPPKLPTTFYALNYFMMNIVTGNFLNTELMITTSVKNSNLGKTLIHSPGKNSSSDIIKFIFTAFISIIV